MTGHPRNDDADGGNLLGSIYIEDEIEVVVVMTHRTASMSGLIIHSDLFAVAGSRGREMR